MDTALTLALIVLAAAGIWVLVEIALTVRRGRGTLDTADVAIADLVKQANVTLDNIQPTIAQLNTTIENLQPTVQGTAPLLDKAGNTIDALTLDLLRVDEILSDLSSVTSTASKASDSVEGITSGAADLANSVVDKIKTTFNLGSRPAKRRTVPTQRQLVQPVVAEEGIVNDDAGYFSSATPTGSEAGEDGF